MARRTGSHSDITGPRIRAAALKLFARYGFAAVSMRQIAAEVGLQAGALYLYTPDKETLLFDLLRTHMEDLIAAHDAEAMPDGAPARLDHFVRFHMGRNLGAENFARIEALRRAYEDRLAAILREGQAAGLFRLADVRLATMAIIAMVNGVNTWFREGGRLSRAEVGAIYVDMVRKAVAP